MSKKFTELNAGTIGAGSIFAQAQEPALSGDPYTSTKVSATQIANYVAKGQAFPELNNKTLIQALTGGSGAGTVILTMAEYLALEPAEQTDGHIYVISDFACLFCYGRQYRAMQKLTQAQYDQLSPAEQNDGTLYIITDAATSIGDADDVDLTGLAAGNILRAVSDGQGGIIFKPFVFNVTTSDNNKLLGVSVSGSDISVGAVALYEEGSSGVWHYKKYNNGIIEMWGYSAQTMQPQVNAWGSWYACEIASLGSYPVAFTAIHSIVGTVTITSASGFGEIKEDITSLTTAPTYIFARPTTLGVENRTVVRTLYVRGTWN